MALFRRRTKAATDNPTSGGWISILEPFTGAWQQNQTVSYSSMTSYPTLYACLSRISADIGKLPFVLRRREGSGVKTNISNAAFSPVLRKPNSYQTQQQFREAWVLSKLMYGNAYVLVERDGRNVVTAMYVMDPTRVTPLISNSGDVFYQVSYGTGANLLPDEIGSSQVTIPASEIIHDRMNCLFNQLVGVPPLTAAYWPSVKNLNILQGASSFFGNQSRPGGLLTVPAGISDTNAQKLRDYWNANFIGTASGKIAVLGADAKFTPFVMSSTDAQLVEQMRYSDEQICQPFGVPPFIIGIGTIPAGLKADDMANVYYRFALQSHIEAMEGLITERLGVVAPQFVELDTYQLLRMDTEKRGTVMSGLVSNGIATPNEGRLEFNFPPLDGGDTVYMQQQDYPLDQVRLNRIAQTESAPTKSVEYDSRSVRLDAMAIELARAIGEIEILRGRVESFEKSDPPPDAVSIARSMFDDQAVQTAVSLIAAGEVKQYIDEMGIRSGVDGKDGADGRDGIDGKDGANGKDGVDGKNGVDGKDGVGVSNAVIDRDGNLVLQTFDGKAIRLGRVVGSDGERGIDGRDGNDGADGKDGRDGLGFESLSGAYVDDKGLVLTFRLGNDVREIVTDIPVMRHLGFWSQGVAAKAGNTITHNGSLWIARSDTKQEPDYKSHDWALAARKGADGRSSK